MINLDWNKYAKKRICVALSGGEDSVCLLHLFLENAVRYGIGLSAVTCEHGIRGEESLRDLEFVKKLCDDYKIPLYVFCDDVPKRARETGRGLEEEGRNFRYECFRRILSEGKAELIATAHHEDDLAETVLFRLARGTSLAGIAALREGEGIVRPLAALSKREISAYVKEHGLPFVKDSTNEDEKFSRNAIRKNVLPALEKVVSGAGGHIADFARRAGKDDEYLKELASKKITVRDGEYSFPANLPDPLFYRAVIMALAALGHDRDYTESFLREIEKLRRLQSGKKVRFGTCLAMREGEEIIFFRPEPECLREYPFGVGVFSFGRCEAEVQREGRGLLRADFDAFPEGCVLRTRREGDVFTPFGGGTKTLKKFLTDKKIPARKSKELPLIAHESEVLAVFGVEISRRVMVTDGTRETIFLSLREKE